MEKLNKNNIEIRLSKIRAYILKNFVYLIIFGFLVSLLWTGFFIIGLSSTGELTRSFRVAENTLIVFLCIMSIMLAFIKSHLERFEFSKEMYRFEYHLIGVGFGLLSLAGNPGWIVYAILFQFIIIPFSNRSTLALLVGRIPVNVIANLLSPTKNAGDQLYLICKEIANKQLFKEENTEWNLVNKNLVQEQVLTIDSEYLKRAKQTAEIYPFVHVYYAECEWDSLDKYLIYHFTSQDLDQNVSIGNYTLILGYAGVKEHMETIILQDTKIDVLKLFIFDMIPQLQSSLREFNVPFPNAELLGAFTEVMFTFDKRFNRMDELQEKLNWFESQKERYKSAFIDLKECYGAENRELMTMLGRHKQELGLEDINLQERAATTDLGGYVVEHKWSIGGAITITGIIIFFILLFGLGLA